MPLRALSSVDVAWLLAQVGIIFKRHGKEDIFEGFHNGRVRVGNCSAQQAIHSARYIQQHFASSGNDQARSRRDLDASKVICVR